MIDYTARWLGRPDFLGGVLPGTRTRTSRPLGWILNLPLVRFERVVPEPAAVSPSVLRRRLSDVSNPPTRKSANERLI